MLSRRHFLRSASGLTAALSLSPGCAARWISRSDAYAAWRFPDPSLPPELRVVHAGLLAANPHNTQPWAFEVDEARVGLLRDLGRWLGPMDVYCREMHIGLGCVVENMALAAQAEGFRPTLRYPAEGERVAELGLEGEGAEHPALFELIGERTTHRGAYLDEPLPEAVLADLLALTEDEPDVQVRVLHEADERAAFAEATIAATEAIVEDVEMIEASDHWMRYTRREIEAHRDGVTLEAQAMSGAQRGLARLMPTPDAQAGGGYWVENTRRQVEAVGAYILLSTTERDDRAQQLRCGRIYQRLALALTAWGYRCQPLNQLAERQDRERQLGLAPVATEALSALLGEPSRAQMLFRVGVSEGEVLPSPRRALEDVLR
ncbi:MAG: nitroreductase family protein [Alphaproteobacteria bacterium]|nr:nitroreductase family protein [Alphaproteobacteria bacterium]MCB9797430.1 nitroreductase family protein [Alphaproteobacteria bacterium]